MVGPVTVTVSECRRRVAVLMWLLVALAVRAQETDAPPARESPVRIPDIVITGADAIIIVPPLPVLPGGAIPVPPVALTPIRYRPSPADCEPPAGRPELCEPPALVRLQPFFLSGVPPRPVMRDLGVHYPAPDRTGAGNGAGNGQRAGDGLAARTEGRNE